MYKLYCSLTFIVFTLTLSAQRVEIQERCSISEKPDLAGKKLLELEVLDEIKIIAKGPKGSINGKLDYWYFAEKVLYDEETWEEIETIRGYVFGHFTSYKVEGQRTLNLTFDGCDFGDCFHLLFGEYDFGSANNVYQFPEDLCLDGNDGSTTPNPDYVGKEMSLTINELYTWDYEYCNPDAEPQMIKTPTIVYLKLAQGTPSSANHDKANCITVEDNSQEESGQDPIITTTCTYKDIKVVSTGYADYTGKYTYSNELYQVVLGENVAVKLSKLLNEGQSKLLEILQAGAEKEFNGFLERDDITECIEFTSLPTLKIDDFELSFNANSVSFIYNLDVTSDWACGPYAYVSVELKTTEFDRFLK